MDRSSPTRMAQDERSSRPSSAEEALAELIALRDSGRAPDFETWVGRYPEFEVELRELVEDWDDVEERLEAAYQATTGPDSPMVAAPAGAPAIEADQAAPLELRAGAHVGEFELVREIGGGGMGRVWEAVQRPLQRVVALKFIRPDRTDERSIELFEREARAGGRLNDPRIVTVHATGASGGLRWIAQEYVPGERTLAQLVSEARDAPALPAGYFERLARLFADIAEAMHVAHEAGVVHRDLKPRNILLALDGRPKVADFGLARLVDEASLSGPLSLAGTTQYMSPEQVAGKLAGIDRRTDVFSLGVVLYECLTLQRPFGGETTAEIFGQITFRDPPDPRELAPAVPADLAVIALKALEKRPADRFQTLEELAADLRRHLANEPILAQPPTKLQRALKWTRRNPTASVGTALAALLVVAVGIGVMLWRGWTEARLQTFISQALWAIDNGDLDKAREQIGGFYELAPRDPRGHLVLAMGCARFLQLAETQDELTAAERLGFDPAQRETETAEDAYLQGLYLLASLQHRDSGEAARQFERAIELDDEFRHASFPLYQARKAMGDLTGAAQALSAFQDTLRQGDRDINALVDALRAELGEDYRGALAHLERLCADYPPQRQYELRVQRHLGRNYLLAYLEEDPPDPSLLDRAEEALGLAIEQYSGDGGSLACLADVALLRAQASPDAETHRELLDDADRDAGLALELDPTSPMAAEVRAVVALERVARDFDARTADEALLAEAEQRLAELAELEHELPSELDSIRHIDAQLLYFRGAIAAERGDKAEALRLYAKSVERSERQIWARIHLGERLWFDQGQRERPLELFQEALEIWDDGGALDDRKWLFALLVWSFGNADMTGRPGLAREMEARFWTELDADDSEAAAPDLFTMAEFLATPDHERLRDCERAQDLLERHDLERRYAGAGAEPERMLAAIHAATAVQQAVDGFDAGTPDEDLLAAAEDSVERLAAAEQRCREQGELQREWARHMAATLLALRAEIAWAEGDAADALSLLVYAVERSERALRARVLLAQVLEREEEDPARPLELLEEALALWDAGQVAPGQEWLLRTLTGLCRAADRAGAVGLALQVRDRALEELERDASHVRPEDLLTLAAVLAAPHSEELRDCAVALELLERHDLERRLAGSGAEADGALDSIRAACPR